MLHSAYESARYSSVCCLTIPGVNCDHSPVQAILSFCDAPGVRSDELSLYFHSKGMPILFTTEGMFVELGCFLCILVSCLCAGICAGMSSGHFHADLVLATIQDGWDGGSSTGERSQQQEDAVKPASQGHHGNSNVDRCALSCCWCILVTYVVIMSIDGMLVQHREGTGARTSVHGQNPHLQHHRSCQKVTIVKLMAHAVVLWMKLIMVVIMTGKDNRRSKLQRMLTLILVHLSQVCYGRPLLLHPDLLLLQLVAR